MEHSVHVECEGCADVALRVDPGSTGQALLAAAVAALGHEAEDEWEMVGPDGVLDRDAVVDVDVARVEVRKTAAGVARGRLAGCGVRIVTKAALRAAAESRDYDVVRWIVQSGALPAGVLEMELRGACRAGDVDLIRVFIAEGVDADAQDVTCGVTPLIMALASDHTAAADLLLAAGVDVDRQDADGHTALMVCGAPAIGRQLLAEHGADVNLCTWDGETALTCAARHGPESWCLELLTRGASVHTVTRTGITPLMYAAESGFAEACRAMVAGGADVNAAAHEGYTALMYAAENDCEDVLAVLAELGADAGACVRMPH
eukprot:TRINITY_DN22740_c0_g1_i1.p2 TRINITY_DN22740_c0_g1~~TRINITY_DN22740_c0_g1_i1.p2  ORF type:complete len:318 (+),score=90.36 TRINITY_DN22740_c0_g1_i1:48-1001(+)